MAAYGQINASLTLLGRLLDQFTSHNKIINNSLIISPDYLKLRAGLIQALEPFPQARIEVAKVLRSLETVEALPSNNGNSKLATT